jgi:gamma-glutamylaminecyclotransferase
MTPEPGGLDRPRRLLFVYGTLKRGGENHARLQAQTLLGPARTSAGYRLYQLDGYPGMVADASQAGSVSGEVWAVDDPALAELDLFEGVDEGLYERVAVRLAPPFEGQHVETYLYLRDLGGRRSLAGEWPV